jgi:hypothetical protein
MDVCPKCKRNLLSHSSKRCNWCGEVLTDPDYVKEAEANRAAFYLHDRLQAAMEVACVDAISPIYGTGLGGGVFPRDGWFGESAYVPRVPKVPEMSLRPGINQTQADVAAPAHSDAEVCETPEEETADRAKHLEL